ncbi:NAD(P)H-dependent oxidoreductase [Sinomicrobium sp. M5D2P9]
MKHLIVYAHPNPESANAWLKENLEDYLKRNGHKVRTRDLYRIRFNPVLSLSDVQGQRKGIVAHDVKTEQEYISWADCITFIYPVWWTGLPAMMKGYIDRVFSYGFAYRYDNGVQKGLLSGKNTVIVNTHGKSAEEYRQTGMDRALALTSDSGIYTYSGLEIVKHFYLDRADRATGTDLERWLKTVLETYAAG